MDVTVLMWLLSFKPLWSSLYCHVVIFCTYLAIFNKYKSTGDMYNKLFLIDVIYQKEFVGLTIIWKFDSKIWDSLSLVWKNKNRGNACFLHFHWLWYSCVIKKCLYNQCYKWPWAILPFSCIRNKRFDISSMISFSLYNYC